MTVENDNIRNNFIFNMPGDLPSILTSFFPQINDKVTQILIFRIS